MGESEWRLGSELRLAGDRDVALAGNTDIQRLFPEVAALIAHEHRTVEQEALLAHWEWVQAKLP